MQDSLPAAGPALPGGIGYPQGSCERFYGCNDSPFPSFLARCQLNFRLVTSADNDYFLLKHDLAPIIRATQEKDLQQYLIRRAINRNDRARFASACYSTHWSM